MKCAVHTAAFINDVILNACSSLKLCEMVGAYHVHNISKFHQIPYGHIWEINIFVQKLGALKVNLAISHKYEKVNKDGLIKCLSV